MLDSAYKALGRLAQRLINYPRHTKRLLIVTCDLLAFAVTIWGLMALRHGTPYMPPNWVIFSILACGPILTVTTFAYLGFYQLVTRFFGYHGSVRLILGALICGLLWALVVQMSGMPGIPRSVIVAFGPACALVAVLIRQAAGIALASGGISIPKLDLESKRKKVIIYGAGASGVNLLDEMRRGEGFDPIAFVDPNPTLWRQYIRGIKIHSPEKLARLIDLGSVAEVIVALPDDHPAERRDALKQLTLLPVKARVFNSISEPQSSEPASDTLRPVKPSDLLGRDRVAPKALLLKRASEGKSILVTGAGGSIGSEIVRRLLRLSPSRIVLLDSSELALYEIMSEVTAKIAARDHKRSSDPAPEIAGVLGSVLNESLIAGVFAKYQIDSIFHAAAYKHVPIVEQNPFVALANNTLGTAVLARAAIAASAKRFVLVSTDKAVRPASIMGASKRLAELVLQALSSSLDGKDNRTVLTSVRFGNVLDSSGSVVRKFRQQIDAGGPLTVTDPEVTRYFMSLEESAELVIQAGAMAEGGEVFFLDMGERIKIDDLARLMIHARGYQVRSADHPAGEIEIRYVGLVPGEKLHEELQLGNNPTTTEHPKILRTREPSLPIAQLESELLLLGAAINSLDLDGVVSVLKRTVEDYSGGLSEFSNQHLSRVVTERRRTLH